MYKFEMGQVVWASWPYKQEGIVVGQYCEFRHGQPPRISYEIAMSLRRFQEHTGGAVQFLGDINVYRRLLEVDLCRLEDAPTWPNGVSTETSNALDRLGAMFGINRHACECGNPKNPIGQGHSDWCKLFKREF